MRKEEFIYTLALNLLLAFFGTVLSLFVIGAILLVGGVGVIFVGAVILSILWFTVISPLLALVIVMNHMADLPGREEVTGFITRLFILSLPFLYFIWANVQQSSLGELSTSIFGIGVLPFNLFSPLLGPLVNILGSIGALLFIGIGAAFWSTVALIVASLPSAVHHYRKKK